MSKLSIDQPGPLREVEGLDQPALEDWLRQVLQQPEGKLESVAQFAAGSSNLTYLIEFAGQPMVLRRPPFGGRGGSAHDMAREHAVLSRIHPLFPLAPEPLAMCEDSSIIGAPFYLMQRLSGVILRREAPSALADDAQACQRLCENWIDLLAKLHDLDIESNDLGSLGQPNGYVARQVAGWNRRYAAARTDDVPEASKLMAWLEAEQPPDRTPAALIHNDYKFDNVVLDPHQPERIIGVLDWEMATVGDPLMDLGCSLAYWVEADDTPAFQAIRMMPTHLPGMLNREQLVARYCQQRGLSDVSFDFYRIFGLFRLAGIAQQIYARYVAGHTRDPRFADFGKLVGILIHAASQRAGLR